MNRMNVLRKVLIAAGILAVILFVCIALLAANLGQSASESFRSSYHYDLTISTSGPIEDAVLLIPLPSRYDPKTGANVTPLDLSRASFSHFDRDNISVTIEHVDDIPMLNISADRIDPVYRNRITPIPIMPGQNESELPKPTQIYSNRYSEETPVLVEMELYVPGTGPDHEIDTRTPIGTEPLLAPYRIVGNLSSSGGPTDGYYVSPGSSGYIMEVPFILSFDADDDNVLAISCGFLGTNQWWVLGWQSNSYSESLRHEFRGACNGTYPVRGVLLTGKGVY
ncbi:hypothetical protein [Methanoculleus sp. 10]|uniref:hypothetical protein n=1 Tax=Methanoculleus sp. 10 TaxID=430615 RepID=UPI0025E88F1F|nr:hypothetical protein [Methanoculleus sp. 10]